MNEPSNDYPPYAFVPGGPWPHPISDPMGHSFGSRRDPPPRIEEDDWRGSPDYLRGFGLFNAGFYWEAHEVWEGLWLAHGRHGRIADVLKGLIKLAAAGVKVRQGQTHGIVTHARRASALFDQARLEDGEKCLGLDLRKLQAIADGLVLDPPMTRGDSSSQVHRVFEFQIDPVQETTEARGRGDSSL